MAKGNGRFLKKQPGVAHSGGLPKNMKKNPGPKAPDNTIYHDTDNDRAHKRSPDLGYDDTIIPTTKYNDGSAK